MAATISRRTRLTSITLAAVLAAVPAVGQPTAAQADTAGVAVLGSVTVAAGETWVVPRTVHLRSLTIAVGGAVVAPAGYSLTLTVDRVETGQSLTETGGAVTQIVAGTYRGRIVLTVAEANPVAWQTLTFPFRQALYVAATGVVDAKSVRDAVSGGRVTAEAATDVRITSTGDAFNGVYLKDGDYQLVRPTISLSGNGRSDFVGYGAAVVATGADTRLVVDGATITNQGSVRTGVVADGGSNVIVKNSRIHTGDGVLPAGYQSTVDLTYMQQAPWMLGIVGNVRATNLLGVDTRASYINSKISAEGWGVLSTDTGQNGQLTAINSTIGTGGEGYGSYAIGNATERFLGSRFDVDTYAAINRGGSIYYGDSTRAAVSDLNSQLELGLSPRELAALPVRNTIVNSQRWGVMWHGAGTVDVSGGTRINTALATFLDKGQQVGITVDGSRGARLNPANGIILQMMEDDDPGPQFVNGKLVNTGVYHEPTGEPSRIDSFDVTAVHQQDAAATFADITLRGNFFNGIRGGATGKNMVLTFADSRITGVISATATRHAVDTITAADYLQLGQITNTAHPIVNNGVIVTLNGTSRWTVTGTSYLSKLTIGAAAAVTAAPGHRVSMTVDGVPTAITPGITYTGAIVVTTS